AEEPCKEHIELLVQGLWFVFIADGRLSTEETACLAQRLDDVSTDQRRAILRCLVGDEATFLDRLRSLPKTARDSFYRVLEAAAALAKAPSLPEARFLRRAAEALGRDYDPEQLKKLTAQLDETGVLS